jgi:hypothetical protein
MPYKEKLKNPSTQPIKKVHYKVLNWTEYNQSLKKRGKLSLYFPPGEIKTQFINEAPYVRGVAGQQATYKQPYIELIYTFYRLFDWGIRQITGFFEDLWRTKKLDILVPSFGHLSDLFSAIPLKVRQFCDKVAKRINNGEPITLIFDSTGLGFGKASHWYQTKYGKPCNQTPWRKMHLSMDPQMNIHGIDITETEIADIDKMEALIPDEIANFLEKVVADGGYYSKEIVEKFYNQGITPSIPPPSHAVVQGKANTKWHDKIVQYIKEKGTVYAFHKKYGYGVRSLVEAQFSRIKRCIGSSLKTQRTESQKREGIVIGNIINRWNSFGQCVCVKIG